MKKEAFIVSMAIAGLLTGLVASQALESEPSRCQQIEEEIRSGQNFTGSVACYPPGSMDVNISEEIENRTELECVCRKVNNGDIQLFPITVAR